MELRNLDKDTVFCSISTFSGGGIGDAGIEWGCKVPVISACELVPDRAGLIRYNYPETHVFQGDIWQLKDDIIQHAKDQLNNKSPWLFVMSPPCQGMSSNGAGRISASMAQGKRPIEDERNRLVLPGVKIIEELCPSWFILENVRRMENTIISNEKGEPEKILDLLGRRLHPLGYTIRSSIIDFRDLGVPHHRQRLITIGCRLPDVKLRAPIGPIFQSKSSILHPPQTHGGSNQPSHITMRESIGHMPKLDAIEKTIDEDDPYHHIPKWSEHHYHCMSHTPEGETAFHNNKCISCNFSENELLDVDCKKCGKQLPKPQIELIEWKCSECDLTHRQNKSICHCGFMRTEAIPLEKNRRVVRGFKTSYRRLKWNKPASTLTMNSGVISSDMKGHPEQNRVLSVREILLLSSLEAHPGADYPWDCKYQFRSISESKEVFYGGDFSPKLVRQVIGESIPPLAMYKIVSRLMELDNRIDFKNSDNSDSTYQTQITAYS